MCPLYVSGPSGKRTVRSIQAGKLIRFEGTIEKD
jgi:hypothetical protein